LPARGSFANLPEVSLTGVSPPTASALQARLEKVIRRMQKVQASILLSRQPASRRELLELADTDREYAHIIEQLVRVQREDAG
jgi:hypothetical protein